MIFVKVLSTSVAEAFALFDYPDTSETERFVRTFDKFFDCLNVRSTDEYVKQWKPNLRPYNDVTDERLTVSVSCFLKLRHKLKVAILAIFAYTQWLEHSLLGYLKEWECR